MKICNTYNRPETLLLKNNKSLREELYPSLTMVKPDVLGITDDLLTRVSGLEGDIVDCGVWSGGSSIYLAALFPDRKIIIVDSFKGFEPVGRSPYSLPAADFNNVGESNGLERHHPDKTFMVEGEEVSCAVSLKKVIQNLKSYGLEPSTMGIEFIEGYVSNTLPNTKQIDKIALLRVDVDSYAATYEVLINLYSKVVEGGIIIFDDMGVEEATMAIDRFLEEKRIYDPTFLPYGKKGGCYIIKSELTTRKKYCFDLDGTICETKKSEETYSDVLPIEGMPELLRELKSKDNYIIIYTARNMVTYNGNIGKINKYQTPVIIDWLKKYDIPFDELILSKVVSDYYVDDKAIRFTNTNQLRQDLKL